MRNQIRLGNKSPKKYINNPSIPLVDPDLDQLIYWTSSICKLDISKIPEIDEKFTESHKKAFLLDLIQKPRLVSDWEKDDIEYVTTIELSPDSTITQNLRDVITIWDAHSFDDAPDWIGYTSQSKLLASLLGEHYSIKDLREINDN